MELEYVESSIKRAVAHTPAFCGKRGILIAGAVGVAAFFFYRYVLDYYYFGDPLYYQRYYDYLLGRDLISALISQYNYLGSSELIYPIIAWMGANASIERNTLMAFFDGVMYAALLSALRLHRCTAAFIALCLTNFYLVVLATSAERLKFSYICLFIALMAVGRAKFIWLALAPLAHFQTLITQGSIFVWHFFASLSFRMKVILSVLAAATGGVILYFFWGELSGKFASYQGRGSLTETLSGLALFGVALVILRNRVQVSLAIAPLAFLTFILGGERMNMIIFTVFIYFCLKEGRTSHPLVLLVMTYFSFKSIGYVDNVLKYGNGFVVG